MLTSTNAFARALAIGVLASAIPAQITLLDTGSCPSDPFRNTVGVGLTVDNNPPNVQVGQGAVGRNNDPASSTFLPTEYALNPAGGYTIQWWLKPALPLGFGYLFGDSAMVSPFGTFNGGAFRCYCNGTGSAGGNLIVRGIPNQTATVNGPLVSGVNANGFVHLAFRYDPALNECQWFVNGYPDGPPVAQSFGPYNWAGTNLVHMGYNGTSAAGTPGHYDDLRVYDFARSDADIAADYLLAAVGTGPSGAPNQPCHYFDMDLAVAAHTLFIGSTPPGSAPTDPTGTGTRIVTGGTLLEWGSDSPSLPGNPASHLFNLFGPTFGTAGIDPHRAAYLPAPTPPVSYATPLLPGLHLGHGISIPQNPSAILWADGLNLGAIPGLVALAFPGAYQYQLSPNLQFQMPMGVFADGDSFYLQGLAIDASFPQSIAFTNVACFAYKNPQGGPRCHIEARGVGAIQVAAFWEIWNTGDSNITRVQIDATTCIAQGGQATGFSPAGALNSGGTLASGTSFRHLSEQFTGLLNLPPGYTSLGADTGLQFDFGNFSAAIDHLHFDCDSAPSNLDGSAYVGATVTVNFANGQTRSGLMTADPSDPTAAVLDLGITNADYTPPVVTIAGVVNGQTVVAPSGVVATITATDNMDPAPLVSALLDGLPYLSGTAITRVGLHTLQATATDASGNIGVANPIVFEILPRPLHSATAVVSSLSCTPGPGFVELDATILLATHQFNELDINLYSVCLWALNSNGFPLNRKPVPISGSLHPAGGYSYINALAYYQQGYWTMTFRATVADAAIIACPTQLLVTGTGRRGSPSEFDFEAVVSAVVDPNPFQTLASVGLINNDPFVSAPQEAQWPPCKWKSRIGCGPQDVSQGSTNADCSPLDVQRTRKYVWAHCGIFGGMTWALDAACFGQALTTAAVTSNGHMTVWLEGPADCCGCEITCTFTPKFKAKVEICPPAEAYCAGLIDVASTCGCSARAVGGAQAGQNQPITVNLGVSASVGPNGPSATASIGTALTYTGGNAAESAPSANGVCTTNNCSVTISVVGTAELKSLADAHFLNLYAEALAELKEATRGISVAPRCTSPGCVGATPTDPFTF